MTPTGASLAPHNFPYPNQPLKRFGVWMLAGQPAALPTLLSIAFNWEGSADDALNQENKIDGHQMQDLLNNSSLSVALVSPP